MPLALSIFFILFIVFISVVEFLLSFPLPKKNNKKRENLKSVPKIIEGWRSRDRGHGQEQDSRQAVKAGSGGLNNKSYVHGALQAPRRNPFGVRRESLGTGLVGRHRKWITHSSLSSIKQPE